jgi:hypothetical protein
LTLSISNLRFGTSGGDVKIAQTDVDAILRPTADEVKNDQQVAFVCPAAAHFGPDIRIDPIVMADLNVTVNFADPVFVVKLGSALLATSASVTGLRSAM